MQEPETPQSLAERLNLADFIAGLVADLNALRAGAISVPDARARAGIARQILRAVHYVVEAQKVIEGRALPPPARHTKRADTA